MLTAKAVTRGFAAPLPEDFYQWGIYEGPVTSGEEQPAYQPSYEPEEEPEIEDEPQYTTPAPDTSVSVAASASTLG